MTDPATARPDYQYIYRTYPGASSAPLPVMSRPTPPTSLQNRNSLLHSSAPTSSPLKIKQKISLESRVNETTAGLFELVKGGLSSVTSVALFFGAYFFTKLAFAITIKSGLLLGIIPSLLAAGLTLSACKCALIAYQQFKNGFINFCASSSGIYQNYFDRKF